MSISSEHISTRFRRQRTSIAQGWCLPSNVRPRVSGRRKNPQIHVSRAVVPQKKALTMSVFVFVKSLDCWNGTHSLALSIPSSRRHEPRLQHAPYQIGNIIRATPQHNRLRAQARRPYLGNNGVHHRPDGHRVRAQPDHAQSRLCIAQCLCLIRDASQDADEVEVKYQEQETPDPDWPATVFR